MTPTAAPLHVISEVGSLSLVSGIVHGGKVTDFSASTEGQCWPVANFSEFFFSQEDSTVDAGRRKHNLSRLLLFGLQRERSNILKRIENTYFFGFLGLCRGRLGPTWHRVDYNIQKNLNIVAQGCMENFPSSQG